MEVGEEVSSTSENESKETFDCPVESDELSKKPVDVPSLEIKSLLETNEEADDAVKISKLNGDVNDDSSLPSKTTDVEDPEATNVSESISSTETNSCANDEGDFSVTSSEISELPPKAESHDEPVLSNSEEVAEKVTPPEPDQEVDVTPKCEVEKETVEENALAEELEKEEALTISSPTITGCPTDQISIVSCSKIKSPRESLELDSLEAAKKEALSLVEKLALNSSITILRKEVKPETPKATDVPEGRVLRLRPTPKTEPPKSSKPPKPTESRKTSISSNSSADKPTVKTPKSQKRKHDDVEGETNEKTHSTSIQYKGFKKNSKSELTKKSVIKFNPFNPAFRNEFSKTSQVFSNFDPSSLQPEYAQYLGLQPLVKFRCSNCGMSTFQTMNALNAHKAECVKTVSLETQGQQQKLLLSSNALDATTNEPKSANIKLTRKVFLCSACGTYYELWNLFLHMREAHRRYICLECLGMSSSPEKLSDHLKQKHNIVSQTFDDPESFSSSVLPQAFYLMCITCDKIYSEEDKFTNHKCPGKKTDAESSSNSTKNHVVSSQTQTTELTKSQETVQQVAKEAKQPLRRTRESSKRAAKLHQARKEVKEDVQKSAAVKESKELKELVSEVVSGNSSVETSENPEPQQVEQQAETIDEPEKMEVLDSVPTSEEVPPVATAEEESDAKIPSDSVEVEEPLTSVDTPGEIIPDPIVEPEMAPEEDAESNAKPEVSTGETIEAAVVDELPPEEQAIPSPSDLQVSPVPQESSEETKDLVPEEPDTTIFEDSSTVDGAGLSETPVPSEETPIPLPDLSLTLSGKPKSKKNARRSGGRRKRPFTMRSRNRKPKTLPLPVHPIHEVGLLPNPLNHVSFPYDQTDVQARIEGISDPTESNAVENEFKSQTPPTQGYPTPNKITLPPNIFKLKLKPDIESDVDSDDSQRLNLVVDESANNSDAEVKNVEKKDEDEPQTNLELGNIKPNEVPLAGEDIQPMALALDDKIDNVSIQAVLKECVRTSCLSCNYCRHAHKIAVNGKYLALHLLSEHRYMPTKNETPDDVTNKLKSSLDVLDGMYFNSETYDNTDPTIHISHEVDTTFDCFQCNYACGTHKDLFAHKRKSHSKPLLLCIMCKTNFLSYSELLCHLCPGHYTAEIMFHNVHINFRCCFCRLDTIPSAFRLMVHLRKTHHTCDICLEGCTEQQKLSTHLWKHKVNHLCYRCGISYASKPDITKHLFWKHGHESVLCKKCLQKKWPHVYHFCIPPTSFICEECSSTFSKAVALKVHKRLHSQEHPYACGECEKKFISKKLLNRHEERHRIIELNKNGLNNEATQEDDQKDEIINVTDVVDAKDDVEADVKENKDEIKEKIHKKHKKDKKEKVVDLYDLPPLNLSSESDSSDEEEVNKTIVKNEVDEEVKVEAVDETEGVATAAAPETSDVSKSEETAPQETRLEDEFLLPVSDNNLELPDLSFNLEAIKSETEQPPVQVTTEEPTDVKPPEENKVCAVEGIWENFYKTNPTNHNLPYPLCAMKSDVAYGIIMGDHDYCRQTSKGEPTNEDLPSSNLESGIIDDKMEEINLNPEPPGTPVTTHGDDKKKLKSPKKKIKTPNNNENSSSSSDSSSDSDSSSCTCGTNCSCSSSSSNSSSSSSSDSESSAGEDKAKMERRKKKKEKKIKPKVETPPEPPKEEEEEEEEKQPEVEAAPPVPVDPPIQESELETDESSTDEEFYDKQPGKIANQIIAEKRNQLILSVTPSNNNSAASSPQPEQPPVQPVVLPPAEVLPTTPVVKPKARDRKKRRLTPKTPKTPLNVIPPPLQTPHQTPNSFVPQYPEVRPPYPSYDSPVQPQLHRYSTPNVNSTAVNSNAPSPAPSDDKSRSSKRRRIPNKFYGYSSGEDEDRPTPRPRKQPHLHQPGQTPEVTTPVLPRIQQMPPQPSLTPRIQLTLPKQVIRRPSYTKLPKTPKITIAPPPPPPPPVVLPPPPPAPDSSETESDNDAKPTLPPVIYPRAPPPHPHPSEPSSSKTEKDVYCYCRCPYDEVSEMIACDDEACPIEWFHFECVGILVPPRGQWYCPGCRKARGLPT